MKTPLPVVVLVLLAWAAIPAALPGLHLQVSAAEPSVSSDDSPSAAEAEAEEDPAAPDDSPSGEDPVPPSDPLSGQELLEKIDKNFAAKNHVSVSIMIIKGRRGTRTIRAKSWTRGYDESFTEYLDPPRERGTKMLKLKDELWVWTPSADRVIRIAGHMLRQSLMGSDLSYEDFMEDSHLADTYDAKITGEETIDERPCYVLQLTARKEKVAYHSRRLWVDKERYLPLRGDRFAKSGKLIKTARIHEVFKIKDRWYPKKMTFRDVLKKGKGTEFVIESIEFDVTIPDHIFTKASLRP